MTTPPLFFELGHPFVWTSKANREAVLANANDPIWHRFLTEADTHFSEKGELPPARFPVYCHAGDLDEVMAVAVLAYVRGEPKLWHWIADWLRGLVAYFSEARGAWQTNRIQILSGRGAPTGNPGQFFEGFTTGGMYWVEAGLMSTVLHLFDLLEAEAPSALSAPEKVQLCEALSDFADRYAFHEEAFKYSNRGLWANAGVLIAGLTHSDPVTARLLLHRSISRHEEYRSTFFDDGMHGEGAPDYHLMSADGVLCYALTASQVWKEKDFFAGTSIESGNLFRGYPGLPDIVRAYLRTVVPGELLWNNHRGCSVSIPIPLRTSLIYTYQQTRDPEIGWFIQQRMAVTDPNITTPLRVTAATILGLGHYQPLLNFWLYRPIDSDARPPRRFYDVLPDHGAVISRSGWEPSASCVAARFGYEGTGKGHRDHGHVTLTVGGREILSDPYPRFGPKGLETSLFHNTVTLNNTEPTAVIGSLQTAPSLEGVDAFLIRNSGGTLPRRTYLHDPRDETNYWFTNHPKPPEFQFQRAVLHAHQRFLVIVDRVVASAQPGRADWFFHSPLRPDNYSHEASPRCEAYQLQRRNVVAGQESIEINLRGPERQADALVWSDVRLHGESLSATLRMMPLDGAMVVSQGHHSMRVRHSTQSESESDVVDYFLRCRSQNPVARAIWVIQWGDANPVIMVYPSSDGLNLRVDHLSDRFEMEIGFEASELRVKKIS